MSTATVNIAFDKRLLKNIDQAARQEHRSRSELVREAVRAYIDQKERWQNLFAAYDTAMKGRSMTEAEIAGEVRSHRKEKSNGKAR
jgi:CopG family transcriptional regulator / antitoxin EndoAI